MKVVDVNVLLYAANEDADRHVVLRQWWEDALNGDESVGLPWIVVSGFLHISTNSKVDLKPMMIVEWQMEHINAVQKSCISSPRVSRNR